MSSFAAGTLILIPIAPVSRLRPPAPLYDSPVVVAAPGPVTDVWMVERTSDSETYSNGLRIDNRFLTAGRERGAKPVGIVFHATESQSVSFDETENGALQRIGESLLEFVRRRRAYNFVIDRFGRVYRVVGENQEANHAGHSVWADGHRSWVNLNQSFLGVAFETAGAQISPAQVRSGGMLIEMLRHRYPIPAANCVTHAQVSVNPTNMRAGLHVDWASGFPFEAVGLPNNYALPLPAVWAFGFDADAHFNSQAGAPMRAGIAAAEALLAQRAEAEGLRTPVYQKKLRQVYRQMAGHQKR